MILWKAVTSACGFPALIKLTQSALQRGQENTADVEKGIDSDQVDVLFKRPPSRPECHHMKILRENVVRFTSFTSWQCHR